MTNLTSSAPFIGASITIFHPLVELPGSESLIVENLVELLFGFYILCLKDAHFYH